MDGNGRTARKRVTATHWHAFCGLGGAARGFNAAKASLGDTDLDYRCLGGVDSDPGAIADFGRMAGVPGTVLDLFDEGQYRRFHGHAPPLGWREATGRDILASAGYEYPDVVCLSPPCKSNSGLLTHAKSITPKYEALNELTVRGVMLMLDGFAGRLPKLVILENVPGIATRGRTLLDRIMAVLRAEGYAISESAHDCGTIGGLAQSRKRYLLVARLVSAVPPGLYRTPLKKLRGVGELIGRMPMPGDPAYGPLHRCPSLEWKTWCRLAFVRPGSDWRSLADLRVEDGILADYSMVPTHDRHNGFLGVGRWTDPSGVVAGRSLPTNGRFSTNDPRLETTGSTPRGEATWTIGYTHAIVARCEGPPITAPAPGATDRPGAGVGEWDRHAATITSQRSPLQGRYAVSDPRPTSSHGGGGKYGIAPWDAASRTIIAASTTGNGGCACADPRLADDVDAPATAPAAAPALPRPEDRVVAMIRSLQGCWHRPFTTWELAVLQSLADPDGPPPVMEGASDSVWRERIGNAIPSDAARAIAETMGRTLLLARAGKSFFLSDVPLWVRPLCIGLAVDGGGHLGHDASVEA